MAEQRGGRPIAANQRPTGGDKTIEVPADRINLDFVLGNKVMVGTVNANREYFESGVRDMAQAQAEYPGWLPQLLTNPVQGLENFAELFNQLTGDRSAIKVYCEVAEAIAESQPVLETVTAA